MEFGVGVASEDHVSERQRSYMHFLAARPDFVDAKCRATQWLLEILPVGLPVVEYFGGVGLVSTIIRGMLQPSSHVIYELDERCVEQLGFAYPGEDPHVIHGDARAYMGVGLPEPGGIAFLDFPHFTPLQGKWREGFGAVFRCQPSAVVVTDTALSMLGVHKKRYTQQFGLPVEGPRTYAMGFSAWLHRTHRYAATRVAQRGRNALYMLCVPASDPGYQEFREFPLEEEGALFGSGDGFKWLS